ncbi:hypothetical protein PYW07_010219 [Mythimna separata]|uniref:RRM domain-containing protein n=1 Tax=Mythimna separata TaxID=271217 RepID=A0AAD7YHL0_MYTSE|nr:hypothetical protein PYW07_010219 [Mythimna separata]
MRDADILAFFRVLLEDDEFLAKYGEKIAALRRKPSTPKILDSPLSPMPADRGIIPIRSPPGPAPCEAMDTAPPQPYSDDQSGDASSSEEEFQLVEGRKRKAGKAKATMAKKPVAPAPSPSPVPQPSRASPSPRPGSPSPPTAPTAQAKKQRPPPPIYIQDKGKWTDVSKMCMDRKIHYTNARSCQQGIKVQVPTATDYRDLTRSLRERNVPFHTYALPEDTPTRVVIKRVAKEIATSDVKADLISQDIPVQAVHRLHRARGHIEYDMVLVVCDPSPGHHPIFKIRSVCSLTGISIEKPYKPHLVGQCHNCQLYGHAARNCFATPRSSSSLSGSSGYQSSSVTSSKNENHLLVDERKVVFVGRLEEDATKQALGSKFAKFGRVSRVRIHSHDNGTRYGFVTYERARDAWAAVKAASTFARYDVRFGAHCAFFRQSDAEPDVPEA